ncbi:tryptophan synthase alpha chain [Scopulibacillus darangshiensis]|uniref:Tryptophan synthase alpha chain n=1 Tax=Scopulibacillus darangshiensis TaxID=442528 RepID=A0A4R2PCI1_9BACL|nr:tryptophan synthase subunit alpha [Scopulibacillus darangshiensis]TCP31635.1 tryptophan synthase alpha chain [Scopulibacillus darangshiensis]
MKRLNNYVNKNNKMLFIPFITVGDPNTETTIELALELQAMGAHALELGIPYSDPLADGPVIQRASIRSLDKGMTLAKAMKLVEVLRDRGLEIPVIIFTYYNLLLQLTEEKFVEYAKAYDIDGLLVPDLPFEESISLRDMCANNGIALISLVAPTTSATRLQEIGKASHGFLYCVSSLGVTGVRQDFHPDVYSFLHHVRKESSLPIAVGFGVSSAKQIIALQDHCDGFIVGSAIIKEVEQRLSLLEDEETRCQAVRDIRKVLEKNLDYNDEVLGNHEGTAQNTQTLPTRETS